MRGESLNIRTAVVFCEGIERVLQSLATEGLAVGFDFR